MSQPGIDKTRTFPGLPSAIAGLSRAAANLAKNPKDVALREEYDAVVRGVKDLVSQLTNDADFKVRKEHYERYRSALRAALEDPEMQPTDARYLGYLAALRFVAKRLNVSWPPYGPDDRALLGDEASQATD